MANEPYRLTQTGAEVQADLNDIEALGLATEETAGKMSAADKVKLDNLPSGSELSESLGGKVDKVQGKGLSTNDYTDEDKNAVRNALPLGVQLALDRTQDIDSIRAGAAAGATAYQKPPTGIPAADLASGVIPDVSGKADKVSSPTAGNFAGLDSNGNLTDSGKKASDFATAAQGSKADSALQSQKQADWNEDDSNDPAYIKNKPNIPSGVVVDQTYDGTSANAQSGVAMSGALATKQDTINDLSDIRTGAGLGATAVQPEAGKGLFSGSYTDLTNKPTIPDAQIQSDWNQSDNAAKDYIKNKPSIPAAQVNSDWNANSGVAQILNKPSIPDAVEANPTVPSGTTPTDLTGLKVGSSYYGIPSPTVDNTPTKNSTNLVKSGGVYDEVHPATGSSQPAGGMLPNVMYNLGTLTGSVTIAFASPTDNNIENEYKFGFTAGSTAPTITWPNTITDWAGNALDSTNNVPEIDADTYYEISVINGHGIIAKFL